MWVFFGESTLSIVAHRTRPDSLLVRSRGRNDIGEIFPFAEVEHTPEADYPYRATIKRDRVATVVGNHLRTIDYDNFKASVRQSYRAELYARIHRFLAANCTPGMRRPRRRRED